MTLLATASSTSPPGDTGWRTWATEPSARIRSLKGRNTITWHVFASRIRTAMADRISLSSKKAWHGVMSEKPTLYAWPGLKTPAIPGRCRGKLTLSTGVRSPHSLDVADLDGDGELEIVVGEHDPFNPYRNRSQLYIYKKAEPQGRAWYRYPIEDRFEHHDGTKVFEVAPGRLAIMSHAWLDVKYVHLWEPY